MTILWKKWNRWKVEPAAIAAWLLYVLMLAPLTASRAADQDSVPGDQALAASPDPSSTAVDPEDLTIDDVRFTQWLDALKAEAVGQGLDETLVVNALEGVRPHPKVIELDRNQPEFTTTYTSYLTARVTAARISRGKSQRLKYAAPLTRVEAKYSVQRRFILAIWGMETNYGGFTGSYSVVRSLLTLAYDDRRSAYFRGELLGALKILAQGDTTPDNMQGSWAGAMGQTQFMPSSFLAHAQDFDGDGRRDIWTTEADVFASIANYLKVHGWNDDVTWGRQVLLPDNFATTVAPKVARVAPPKYCARALKDHSRQLSLADWSAFGLKRLNGRPLPRRDLEASLVLPEGEGGPAYLTYPNFRSILSYNCSNFYALAVGHLAYALRDTK